VRVLNRAIGILRYKDDYYDSAECEDEENFLQQNNVCASNRVKGRKLLSAKSVELN
jgi:hypothetical protein